MTTCAEVGSSLHRPRFYEDEVSDPMTTAVLTGLAVEFTMVL